MSRIVPVQTMDQIIVSTSIYADDMCLWAASKNAPQLVATVQDAIDQLGTNLANLGLEDSVQRSRFVCFRPLGALRVRVVLHINGCWLDAASSHTFIHLKASLLTPDAMGSRKLEPLWPRQEVRLWILYGSHGQSGGALLKHS